MAVNQEFLDRLLDLVKQKVVNENDIKIQEYKDAVQAVVNPQ